MGLTRIKRPVILDGDIARILLPDGREAIVDAADIGIVAGRSWFTTGRLDNYVECRINKRGTYLHRLLMQPPDGYYVDHINGDTFDNRRSNLRVCTNRENLRNMGRNRVNTSGFKGVGFHRGMSAWRARLRGDDQKEVVVGYFKTAEEAALAYDEVAKKVYGEFARLNFSQ